MKTIVISENEMFSNEPISVIEMCNIFCAAITGAVQDLRSKYHTDKDADKVTIGVYEDNLPAYKCYESIGFHKGGELEDHYEDVLGEKCKVVELEIKKEEWQCECH